MSASRTALVISGARAAQANSVLSTLKTTLNHHEAWQAFFSIFQDKELIVAYVPDGPPVKGAIDGTTNTLKRFGFKGAADNIQKLTTSIGKIGAPVGKAVEALKTSSYRSTNVIGNEEKMSVTFTLKSEQLWPDGVLELILALDEKKLLFSGNFPGMGRDVRVLGELSLDMAKYAEGEFKSDATNTFFQISGVIKIFLL